MRDSWPAILYDLVPQGNGRRFLLGQLRLPDAQSSDLPLLRAGAFDPIGRLRIREAVQYYVPVRRAAQSPDRLQAADERNAVSHATGDVSASEAMHEVVLARAQLEASMRRKVRSS